MKVVPTRLLYLEDAYKREFEAKILKIEQAEDRVGIVLDSTAFYPVGGGQPADKGEIIGKDGKAIVVDVQKRGGLVFHFAEEVVGKLAEGETVKGVIDWNLSLIHI